MGAGTLSREGGGGGWEKDDSEVIEEEARAEGLQWRKRALGIGNSSMCRGVREEEGDGGRRLYTCCWAAQDCVASVATSVVSLPGMEYCRSA
ncbi:hypothetical protein U1Q18_037370 [Sarracenia purpurea var. burkii]